MGINSITPPKPYPDSAQLYFFNLKAPEQHQKIYYMDVRPYRYLTTNAKPMADAIKQNKKLCPVIKLMMKPITEVHNKIVIILVILYSLCTLFKLNHDV